MTIDGNSIIVQDQEPIAATVDNEIVMLSARAQAYFGLDGVGSKIWNLIAQPRRVAEVCTNLIESYEVDKETCERDVLRFLEELHRHGLIRTVAEGG